MLDEPAACLDENDSAELARLIRRLADERNMGVLLVEHDMGFVMSTCDRIVVIDFGRVIASGTPDAIRGHPAVREAYLGQAAPTGATETQAEHKEGGQEPRPSSNQHAPHRATGHWQAAAPDTLPPP